MSITSTYDAIPSIEIDRDKESQSALDVVGTGFERSYAWRETNIPILAAAFSTALATGAPTYAFGLYGATLKNTLHLSQSQLNTISAANFMAGLISWIPGICVDFWGPKQAMFIGGMVQSVGLFLYWIAAQKFAIWNTDTSIVIPTLSALGVTIFMSNSLVIGSLFKVIVVSCKSGKGSAVGAAKGYVGLGAGAYASIFDAIRIPLGLHSDLDFLPMASILALAAICAPAMLLLPNQEDLERIKDVASPAHYRTIYMGLVLLAMFVVGTSAMFLFEPMPSEEELRTKVDESPSHSMIKGFVILSTWVLPILLLFFWKHQTTVSESLVHRSRDSQAHEVDPLIPSALFSRRTESDEDIAAFEATSKMINREKNYSLHQMLGTAEAWLLLWTSTIVVGSGTVIVNNMGQMTEALEFPSRAPGAFLAIFSVSQAMARVGVGAVSDSAMNWQILGWKYGVPRPLFLIFTSLFVVAGHGVLAVANDRRVFLLGITLSGIGFGMIWPLMVLIVGEVFGTQNHGANYMFYDGFTSAIGTLLISKYLAQSIYEYHIEAEDPEMDDITCYGPRCFQITHIVVALLGFTCLFSSSGVYAMTKLCYKRSFAKKEGQDRVYGSPYMGKPTLKARII